MFEYSLTHSALASLFIFSFLPNALKKYCRYIVRSIADILSEICLKHWPHFSLFNFSWCCYFPFLRNQLDPSCQRFSHDFWIFLVIFSLFWLSPSFLFWEDFLISLTCPASLLFSFDAPRQILRSQPIERRYRRRMFLSYPLLFWHCVIENNSSSKLTNLNHVLVKFQ